MDQDIHCKIDHTDILIVQSQLRSSTIKVETHGKDCTKENRKLLPVERFGQLHLAR